MRSIYNVKVLQLNEVKRLINSPNLQTFRHSRSGLRFDGIEDELFLELGKQDGIYTDIEHRLERRDLLYEPTLEYILRRIRAWENGVNVVIDKLILIRNQAQWFLPL